MAQPEMTYESEVDLDRLDDAALKAATALGYNSVKASEEIEIANAAYAQCLTAYESLTSQQQQARHNLERAKKVLMLQEDVLLAIVRHRREARSRAW